MSKSTNYTLTNDVAVNTQLKSAQYVFAKYSYLPLHNIITTNLVYMDAIAKHRIMWFVDLFYNFFESFMLA